MPREKESELAAFSRVREATIQFSDVFGSIPRHEHYDASSLSDFDAVLTATVRNCGHFRDSQFPIGYWPELGDYGAVLVEELRQGQFERATRLGIDAASLDESTDLHKLHPDLSMLARSLTRAIVVVVNCAPRTRAHHSAAQNGDEFFTGITRSGIEVYAQLPFFRGLHARGWISSLFRIPNDSGVWTPGEQFRSSCVTQARSLPGVLEAVSPGLIPPLRSTLRVAYVDKFGNVRIEVNDPHALALLASHDTLTLRVGKGSEIPVLVVERLTQIPEGALGVYRNPADAVESGSPAYIECVRRVSNPNGNADNAYLTLIRALTQTPETFDPSAWREVDLELVP